MRLPMAGWSFTSRHIFIHRHGQSLRGVVDLIVPSSNFDFVQPGGDGRHRYSSATLRLRRGRSSSWEPDQSPAGSAEQIADRLIQRKGGRSTGNPSDVRQ